MIIIIIYFNMHVFEGSDHAFWSAILETKPIIIDGHVFRQSEAVIKKQKFIIVFLIIISSPFVLGTEVGWWTPFDSLLFTPEGIFISPFGIYKLRLPFL